MNNLTASYKLCLCVILLLGFQTALAQFWTEDFGTDPSCANQGQSAAAYTGVNGTWSITSSSTGSNPNVWYVSATEAGMGVGNCGDGCLSTAQTNQTLHIGADAIGGGDIGAAYLETGFSLSDADTRAESPTINCTGQSGISLDFLYMENGNASSDNAELWYFDGTSWSMLFDMAKTALTCAPQGVWTAFNITLPASADNNANVKIGFRWVNVDDGVATDPSVAIDDITLTSGAPPSTIVASFTSTYSTPICEGACLTFTDNSTGSGITTWDWQFPGSSTPTFSGQTPPSICYPTAGTYNVTLQIGDGTSTDDTIMNGYVTVITCGGTLVASFTSNYTSPICEGACLNFTDNSTGAGITTWNWQFPGSSTPTYSGQTPPAICYPTAGSYDVTLTIGDGTTTDDTTILSYITVITCGNNPVASFTSSYSAPICTGDCVNFTDVSTNSPTSWSWTFGGGTPASSTAQNPTICYNNTGTYSVTLQVTNASGTDDTTITNYITVQSCANPVMSDTLDRYVCLGDCYNYTLDTANLSSWQFTLYVPDKDTGYLYNPPFDTLVYTNVIPGTVCYDSTGQFPVQIILQNGFGSSSYAFTVTVPDPPFVQAFGDTTILIGTSADLSAIGSGFEFVWSPDTGTCMTDNCGQYSANPLITTNYIVTLLDENTNCPGRDTATVTVEEEYYVAVPNAFSPNHDGQNDILYVLGNGIANINYSIYNRYGQQVFVSTDMANGWDGTYKDKDLNPGVFVYYVKATFINGTRQEIKGNVTLVR